MMLKNPKNKIFQYDFGFAVFNYENMMRKFETFRKEWISYNSPPLYFVTMDIGKCYDNVNALKVV